MPNPLENKLLLYYLSGIGGAMGGKGSVAETVGGITQGQIQSQNYMKMLQSMLSGLPAGAKVAGDRDNFNVKIPTGSLFSNEELKGMLGEEGTSTTTAAPQPTSPSGTTDVLPPEQRKTLMAGTGMLNPSPSLPDVSGADLAGLTPKEISQALQFKMGYEELGQKRITDVVDMMYKMAGIKKLGAEAEALGRKSPVPLPGIGEIDFETWKTLPKEEKEYAIYYDYTTRVLGDEEPLDRQEYGAMDPTEKEKFLRAAMRDPQLMKAAKDLAKSGATRISLGELGAREEQRWDIKSRKYFTSKDFSADIDKYINETVRRATWMGDEQPERAKAGQIYDYIETKITSQGGKVKGEPKVKGRSVTWTVEWPDGETSEVSYAF